MPRSKTVWILLSSLAILDASAAAQITADPVKIIQAIASKAKRNGTGDLREVYSYRWQLKGHTEREYHRGS